MWNACSERILVMRSGGNLWLNGVSVLSDRMHSQNYILYQVPLKAIVEV